MTFSATDVLSHHVAGSAMQNDFQCYRRAIASRLVDRAKDKTVRKSASLQLSVGTVIATVLNCIPRFRIVTYIQPPSCLWYDNARPKGNLGSARKTAAPSP